MWYKLQAGDYLSHSGIPGMKWGVRRYQNEDGSLTPAGRERYYKDTVSELKNQVEGYTARAMVNAKRKGRRIKRKESYALLHPTSFAIKNTFKMSTSGMRIAAKARAIERSEKFQSIKRQTLNEAKPYVEAGAKEFKKYWHLYNI